MKVLIAEDEPSIVTSLEFLMRGCGFEVRVALDGEAALGAAREWRPDVLLLDVMMPRCDGFEVCRRLRADPATRALRIVMLTARGREGQVARGLALGADLYVTKPFSNKDLVAKVKGLMP